MKITKLLVDRYLKGECTTAEASAIESLLEQDPTALDDFFPEEEWENSPIDNSYEGQDDAYERLARQIRPKAGIPMLYIRLAASIAAIFLIVFGIYKYQYTPATPQSEPTLLTVQSNPELSTANLYYINSGYENMVLAASDGTTITLYPQSEVRYAEDFNLLSERTIHLKGRAKFEVAKDKTKPFRVLSKGIVTTALGTIFIVDEFTSAETRVQLLEGIIQVTSKRKVDSSAVVKTFKPMEEVTINHQQGQIIQEKKINNSKENREAYFVRQSHRLQFKNLALQDVVSILNQNYGIDLQYPTQSLDGKYYSGTFRESNDVYQDIIKEINYLHHTNITYTKK